MKRKNTLVGKFINEEHCLAMKLNILNIIIVDKRKKDTGKVQVFFSSYYYH